MFLIFFLLTTGKQVVLFFQMLQLSLIFVQHTLNLVSAIFYQIFTFYQMIALQKLWKMFDFILKAIFVLKIFKFLYFRLSLFFFAIIHCFRGWIKRNLKVYDVINCPNENLITHFVWYLENKIRCDIETLSIDGVLDMENFSGKIMQKMFTKS